MENCNARFPTAGENDVLPVERRLSERRADPVAAGRIVAPPFAAPASQPSAHSTALPNGWFARVKDENTIIVQHKEIGGAVVRKDDSDVRASIFYEFVASILSAAPASQHGSAQRGDIYYQGNDGGFLDSCGWYANCDGASSTAYVPIYRHGKVIALVVSTSDDYETELRANCEILVSGPTPTETAKGSIGDDPKFRAKFSAYNTAMLTESEFCAYIDTILAASKAAPARLTYEQIAVGARRLSDQNAAVCNVNAEDNWKIYGDDYLEEFKDAVSAALATQQKEG